MSASGGLGVVPEVEVLRHVHLLKDAHETLFLGRFVDLLIKTNWNNVCAFAVIQIVPSKQGHDGPL